MLEKVFYRAKDIANKGNFSRATVYQLVKKGLLPKPQKVGKISLWKAEDVNAFFESVKKGSC